MSKALHEYVQAPDLIIESCYSCAVEFGIPRGLYNRLQQDHSTFYCPNGHQQHYIAKSEAEKLREELARKDQEIERQNRRIEFAKNEAESERRSKIATKGVLTKLRKRVAAGVCPCCKRTFRNVALHMKGQHPEWSDGE